MTLQEAYQGWQMVKDNRALYMRSKDAFRKVWLMLPTNKPCGYYTLEVLVSAITQTKMDYSFRVQAASVMLHVLVYAHNQDPDENPLPPFTYNEVLLGAREKEGGQKDDEDDTDLDIDPVTGMPRRAMAKEETVDTVSVREKMDVKEIDVARISSKTLPEPCDEHGNALTSKKTLEEILEEPLEETLEAATDNKPTVKDMEQKKKQWDNTPKRVCQIDPETLKVVKTFDSCSQACKAMGIKSIDYAMKSLGKAGGYYWQYPDGVETFKDRLAEKNAVRISTVSAAARQPTDREKHIPEPERLVRKTDFHNETLKSFSDKELIDELKERGWKGDLKLTLAVSL